MKSLLFCLLITLVASVAADAQTYNVGVGYSEMYVVSTGNKVDDRYTSVSFDATFDLPSNIHLNAGVWGALGLESYLNGSKGKLEAIEADYWVSVKTPLDSADEVQATIEAALYDIVGDEKVGNWESHILSFKGVVSFSNFNAQIQILNPNGSDKVGTLFALTYTSKWKDHFILPFTLSPSLTIRTGSNVFSGDDATFFQWKAPLVIDFGLPSSITTTVGARGSHALTRTEDGRKSHV